ncbi:hypothetical protein, partial [Escherichia coli]
LSYQFLSNGYIRRSVYAYKLSHFSREYSRMFGESPKRDITRLRKSVGQL